MNTRDYKIVRSHAEVLRALGIPLQQAVKLLATKQSCNTPLFMAVHLLARKSVTR